MRQLKKFFQKVERCASCKAAKNPLRHVFGGGQYNRPKYFFLFINPTHKNLSTDPKYKGRARFPFIGVRHFYRELSRAGFVEPKIVADFYKRGWRLGDELRVARSLARSGVYMSNFVKCARPDPTNPSLTLMRKHLPLLAEELSIVKPKFIVTFGLPPLKVLTGTAARMRDILEALRRRRYAPRVSVPLGGRTYPVLPCYYLLGHGNPPKAQEILAYIKRHFA
ncbi:MAG: hypothetical protein HY470_00970 [Candidatus Ryanbacteria bacterium]|nr:hypothetical protein [Candidatus Ryanbacteria bacterium]